MNYFVHTLMYFYYFCMTYGGKLKALARPWNMLLTSVQLLQVRALRILIPEVQQLVLR